MTSITVQDAFNQHLANKSGVRLLYGSATVTGIRQLDLFGYFVVDTDADTEYLAPHCELGVIEVASVATADEPIAYNLEILKAVPSINDYYGRNPKMNVPYIKKRGKEFRQHVHALCEQHGITQPISGNVAMTVIISRKNREIDVDNPQKAILDSFNGYAYHDDKQVVELHIYKFMGCKRQKIEVRIKQIKD